MAKVNARYVRDAVALQRKIVEDKTALERSDFVSRFVIVLNNLGIETSSDEAQFFTERSLTVYVILNDNTWITCEILTDLVRVRITRWESKEDPKYSVPSIVKKEIGHIDLYPDNILFQLNPRSSVLVPAVAMGTTTLFPELLSDDEE